MQSLDDLILPFIKSIADGQVEIYNEFSLQHELGIFLRHRLPAYKVQFERNVKFFFPDSNFSFTKKEIDISVFSPDQNELKWAIELKYPRNGQHPEQMFSFCKDLAFVEELKAGGFMQTGVLILASDHLFYRGSQDGIYGLFRGGRLISGLIQKPTKPKNESVNIRGIYNAVWKEVMDPLMYAAIETTNPTRYYSGIN